MINRDIINKFITWTNLVGILSIIFGALSALAGLVALIIGAIPGVLMVIMGIKLLNAKKEAQELLNLEDMALVIPKFEQLLNEVTTYFKIQGIVFIVSLVIGIIGIVANIFILSSLFGSMY